MSKRHRTNFTMKEVIHIVAQRENALLFNIIDCCINVDGEKDFDYSFWIDKFYNDSLLDRIPSTIAPTCFDDFLEWDSPLRTGHQPSTDYRKKVTP